jgi:hypothetical protein
MVIELNKAEMSGACSKHWEIYLSNFGRKNFRGSNELGEVDVERG